MAERHTTAVYEAVVILLVGSLFTYALYGFADIHKNSLCRDASDMLTIQAGMNILRIRAERAESAMRKCVPGWKCVSFSAYRIDGGWEIVTADESERLMVLTDQCERSRASSGSGNPSEMHPILVDNVAIRPP